MSMEHWWNDTDRVETEVLGETPVPVPTVPSEMSHSLM
jgi:hypothetical protein